MIGVTGWIKSTAGDDDFGRFSAALRANVGLGGSVLDGLVRADLARGLRDPTGWRFDFYVDGVF